ncbi:NrfD/PsrC family molybdoenzyme membrane anchor subunit [Candidatus Magnetomonas plexicatena]|uniref:NrfD/PsrC family molybdoenzyme membrane anchor subunit n=1 Tax=Candidatus Magnetomonas plexicatena TaxID=2552947 RepID=UPI001C744B9D|nr:polysulfide reductase NrfD [Nitrospirales bacterium LBB_01]
MDEHTLAHGAYWTVKEMFTYPNEYIYWGIHIVIYPYITGLVAGAFVLSSLYHVFGKDELKPVAKFSLVFSLALLIMAPVPLLFHLTQPFRSINITMTPHFYSAISAFTFIYMTYMAIVLSEIWFVFRPFIIKQAQERSGLMGLFYKVLTLGSYDVSEKALHLDEKIVKILATAGIPAASILHGYVGFIFGSVKTVPLWKTPLMPFIFLMSAVISGIAICIVTYIAGMAFKKHFICFVPIKSMCKVLSYFLAIAFLLEGIDIVFHAYTAEEFWGIMSELLFKRFAFKMIVIQWICGMILPFILLTLPRLTMLRGFIAGSLVLMGVFTMRWDVVIGGQSMSRSFAGFLDFHLPVFSSNIEIFKEGLFPAIFLLSAPFFLLYIFNKVLPVFKDIFTEQECAEAEDRLSQRLF